MGKMRRLLAAVLVASMLFGTNGVSYAAETIADDVSQETTEAATEDTESAAPAESDPSETVDAVTQTGAEDSSQDDSEAAEEVTDTETNADDKAAAEDTDTDASETEKANYAAVSETGDAETPESGSSTEAAAEATYSAGKLEFNGDDYGKDYSVTLSYDADAEIPADAQLKVTEIEKDKELEKYEAYLKEANAAVENSVTDARFFDIKIMVGDEEIQPKSAVKVNISYKEAIEVEEKAEVQAVHFDEEKDKPVPVEIETNNDDKVDEVEFEAKTFSVYAVLYTVDFNYTDHAFSIPGGSNIRLSDLAQELGFYAESETKEFSAQDVAKVTFTNPELVKVENQADGDWMLTSLKAFSTKEKLTIDMTNGDQFVVDVTDAQDALDVSVSLYDINGTNQINFSTQDPPFGGYENIYMVVWAGDNSDIKKADASAPWAVVPINNVKTSEGTFTSSVTSFTKDGSTVAYSNLSPEEKSKLNVRVIHDWSEPTFDSLRNMDTANYNVLWNGGFEGYDPMGSDSAHPSGLKDGGKYEVNYKIANEKIPEVVLKFNPQSDQGPIPGNQYYIMLDALGAYNSHKYYVVEVKTDGSEEVVRIPVDNIWSDNQPFSTSWKVTPIVIAPKAGETITPGPNKPEGYTWTSMGDYSHNYLGEVKRTEGTTDYIDYVFELKKAPLDDSLAPVDILGSDGVEFGVIADTFIQNGHTETNFAVKNFDHDANIEIFGSGEGAMPFYAGNIVNQLLIDGDTNVDCDVFYATEDESKVTLNVTQATATKYPTTRESINDYIDDILSDGTEKSSELAGKTTVTPSVPADLNGAPLDFTGFPDHKTIYVDASNLTGAFKNTSGIKIQKKANQSIVFNFPDSGTLDINKFEVETYDDNGNKIDSVDSATVALDGDPGKNKKIDEMIFEHITFNAPNASTVNLTDWSGLLLAPNADINQKNSGGWLLTNHTVTSGSGEGQGAEFHFYRHERHYKSKGDFSLSGLKRIMESGQSKEYSEFASMKFEFELYKCNENGDVAAGAKAIEKVAASSTNGKFSFNKLKYTEADFNGVGQGANGERIKNFHYVIQEVKPSGGKSGSVNYDADPVYVKVVATDTPSAEGSGKGEISFEIYTASKPAEGGQLEWTLARKTGTEDAVYDIGNFDNTYEEEKGSLKITKKVTVNGAATTGTSADGTYTFTVKDESGEVKATKTIKITGGVSGEVQVDNLVPGTYTVSEDVTANPDGMSLVGENDLSITVTANNTANIPVAEFTNNKTEVGSLKITKEVTGTTATDKVFTFEITLTPKDGVTLANSYPAKLNGKDTDDAAVAEGKVTVTLTAGQSYEILELPAGTEYLVTEVETKLPKGYSQGTHQNANGTISSKSEATAQMKNTYEATGTGNISVQKFLNGRDWSTTDKFTFTLTAVSAPEGVSPVPMPAEKSITISKKDLQQKKSFGDITFKKAGTYIYQVEETKGNLGGITYSEEKHTVTFTVKDNDEGKLVADGTELIQTVSISNEYKSSGSIDLKVNKKLIGRPIEKEQFEFGLYVYRPTIKLRGSNTELNSDWHLVDYVYCDTTGKATFSFKDEKFTDVLTFTQNDITDWNENGTGTGTKAFKVAEYIPDDAVNADGVKYEDATPEQRDAGGFKKDGYTYDSSIKSITVNLKDDGKGHIDAEVVKEESDELEFTNTYEAEGEIVLHAQKKLSGARKLEEGQFTFELIEVIEKDDSEVEKVIDTKKNDAKGTVTFDPIKYTQDAIYEKDADGVYSGSGKKEFTYKIREVIPEGAVDNGDGTYFFEGYTYDGNVYTLKVIATDNGDGTITAVDAADTANAGNGTEPTEEKYVFVNAYEAVGGLKLNAEKTYKNGTLRGGEFTFELRDADGKVLQSRKNDAAGYVYFEPLSYELEDAANAPFTYTVREVPGSRTDVKYDATVYTVTVSLEDNGDGTLKVTKKIDNGGALKFVNEQLNVETSVTIGGEKVLKGGTLKNGQFKFVLTDASGKWVDTATNDADGNFTFKPITYKLSDLNGEKAKVFTYGVSEVKGSESRITYDEKVYTVKVTVTDNGDGTMTAKADLAKSDIKFVNREEKKKKDNTKTGDEAPLGVLFGGLGIGAAGLTVLLEDRKRRNRNK